METNLPKEDESPTVKYTEATSAQTPTRECPAEVLRKKTCSVYRSAAHTWGSSNSIVTSSPIVDILQVFARDHRIEAATSLVSIAGASGETKLHYHASHIVGVIVKGEGWLCVPHEDQGNDDIKQVRVAVGDVVVIPQGALHLFECEPEGKLDYVALEFSDKPIDYQKHRLY